MVAITVDDASSIMGDISKTNTRKIHKLPLTLALILAATRGQPEFYRSDVNDAKHRLNGIEFRQMIDLRSQTRHRGHCANTAVPSRSLPPLQCQN
jgi:hypothetical protein